jgi:hypothetical protein
MFRFRSHIEEDRPSAPLPGWPIWAFIALMLGVGVVAATIAAAVA